MPGEPGMMRSIFIKEPETGQLLVAKFMDFHDARWNDEKKEEVLFFKVVIRGDDSDVRVVSLEDIIPRFPTPGEALAFETRKAELEAKKARYPRIQFPLALPRVPTNHVRYPPLKINELKILFLLCQKNGFEMGYNYPFNCLLILFLACGPQDKFFHEVPQLTASERECFIAFQLRYNDEFMGTVMVSKIQRCSKLTVQQVFLAQFQIAKALKISSQCALSLPREYFIDPEPEVILCKGDGVFVPHSSLKKIE
jgi:hypothetical protein